MPHTDFYFYFDKVLAESSMNSVFSCAKVKLVAKAKKAIAQKYCMGAGLGSSQT